MRNQVTVNHSFVDYIPDELEDGVLYISIGFDTAAHNCLCGCGKEVTTPLSPTDWSLTYNGNSVSLDPSVGNWSFNCKSHYWITDGKVIWASEWSRKRIDAARAQERIDKQNYYEAEEQRTLEGTDDETGIWQRLRNWLPF